MSRYVYRNLQATDLWGVYTIQQRSSKLTANVLIKIHMLMLNVCWTFAGLCKHPISQL